MWNVFSVQPRMRVWSRSMILDLPCLRLSIFSRIMSTVTPRMLAKNKMPPNVMTAPIPRSPHRMALECVPGSAMNVHASHALSGNM